MSLYNKFRPQTFRDVVAHEVVMTALQSQLKENRISHAYIMTGQRGTGKTTTAKLLSKYLVCHHNINGEPCNTCEACTKASKGIHEDIYEIDGASNNSVDDVREIIKALSYPPIAGQYKIYVIDEVHMLSNAAFNALLTTIESPPKHVIFIFATTEFHKIPATIRSRCQIFTFNQIDQTLIAERLMYVSAKEHINLELSGAKLIARNADGSMRDALSILEQLSHNIVISATEVNEALGLIDQSYTMSFLEALIEQDTKLCMNRYMEILKLGKSPNQLMESLIEELSALIMTGEKVDLYANVLKSILKFRNDVSKEVNVQLLFNLFIVEHTTGNTAQLVTSVTVEPSKNSDLELRVKRIEDYLAKRISSSRNRAEQATVQQEQVSKAVQVEVKQELKSEPVTVQPAQVNKAVEQTKSVTETPKQQSVSDKSNNGTETGVKVLQVNAIDDILAKLARL